MVKKINGTIVSRNDTTANWQSKNPVLALGEIGIEISSENSLIKIGDGVTHWNNLEYFKADAQEAPSAESTGIPIVVTKGTGTAYTATIPNLDKLYNGLRITLIPHTASTSTNVTLNVNGLGAKNINRSINCHSVNMTRGGMNAWLPANRPINLTYAEKSLCWISDNQTQPYGGSDFYEPVSTSKGGTGATTAANGLSNLGGLAKSGGSMSGVLVAYCNTSYASPQVRNILMSTTDLVPGVSALANGNVYFVYE